MAELLIYLAAFGIVLGIAAFFSHLAEGPSPVIRPDDQLGENGSRPTRMRW